MGGVARRVAHLTRNRWMSCQLGSSYSPMSEREVVIAPMSEREVVKAQKLNKIKHY